MIDFNELVLEATRERLVCAVTIMKDGKKFYGSWHGDCLDQAFEMGYKRSDVLDNHAYLTSNKRIVNDIAGYKISKRAGQWTDDMPPEDVWDDEIPRASSEYINFD